TGTVRAAVAPHEVRAVDAGATASITSPPRAAASTRFGRVTVLQLDTVAQRGRRFRAARGSFRKGSGKGATNYVSALRAIAVVPSTIPHTLELGRHSSKS